MLVIIGLPVRNTYNIPHSRNRYSNPSKSSYTPIVILEGIVILKWHTYLPLLVQSLWYHVVATESRFKAHTRQIRLTEPNGWLDPPGGIFLHNFLPTLASLVQPSQDPKYSYTLITVQKGYSSSTTSHRTAQYMPLGDWWRAVIDWARRVFRRDFVRGCYNSSWWVAVRLAN